jgi:formylglycine-generating enzyme
MDLTCPYCQARTPMPQGISARQVPCSACGRDVYLDELPTMAPARMAPSPPATEHRLNGYDVVKLIARGGMGEVYEAVQKSLNRRVAIKILPRELAADTNFVRRFEREAGALAQLSHPNIVAIYDRGCDDGCYYFVLEYVEALEGGPAATLHRRLRSGPPLKTCDCKRLLEQVAGALAYAHGRGIVHRDIKPSNVLLDARDNARVVDFGIAQLLRSHRGDEMRLTLSGEVLGTASYLAPEQREARGEIDGRADVYACGVMCYEMLTGQLPEGAFEMPSELAPGLDSAWDVFVEKAIQRNRARRFQTMEEMIEALRTLPVDGKLPEPARGPMRKAPDTALQQTPILGKCAQCDTVNPGDNRFCTECGASLYEVCPACESENRVGTKFCGQCGVDAAKLKRTAAHRARIAALLEQANQVQGLPALSPLTDAHELVAKFRAKHPADAEVQKAEATIREKLRPLLLDKARGERGAEGLATCRRILALFPGEAEAQSLLEALEREIQNVTQTIRKQMGKGELQFAMEQIEKGLERFGPEPALLKLRAETEKAKRKKRIVLLIASVAAAMIWAVALAPLFSLVKGVAVSRSNGEESQPSAAYIYQAPKPQKEPPGPGQVQTLDSVRTLPPRSGMSLIPGGSFEMGDSFNEGDSSERPVHTLYVSAFYMDQTEVTKGLWDEVYQWAIANGYAFDNRGLGKAASHPVRGVNWYDVVKWCNARSEKEGRTPAYYTSSAQTAVYTTGQVTVQSDWVKWNAGYRLPTEAEWEKAARGGLSGRRFPWGDTISHSQANYNSSSSSSYDVSSTREYQPRYGTEDRPYTSPVGSFAPNGYGLYDMAGNVWEWCWDWYDDSFYASSPGKDPRGPATGSSRVVRGGGWFNFAIRCRAANRGRDYLAGRIDYMGFRSVLSPGQPYPASDFSQIPADPFEQVFLVRGVLIDIRNNGRIAVINHEEIPGFMRAMTMPFEIRNPAEIKKFKPGDTISFRLVSSENDFWIDQLQPLPR